jgi:N12 class adenine-specific DNA methylase
VPTKHRPQRETHHNTDSCIKRLKDLLAKDKKDDGLVFDELGADHIFIDEAHYFKNLETPTKMERVAGIQTGGSERAFDVYMKARYLDEQHAGHGVTWFMS